ncbi:nucleotide-binding universal stress UspA family protein [Streptomyces sp. SLBN-8D4]|jgi:nucleotide-binding universal stress UspA family protein
MSRTVPVGVDGASESRAAAEWAAREAKLLAKAAEDAELMVLGPRGLSGIGGFLIGSVGMAVIARTETPVVLARSGEQAADEHEKDSAAIASAATHAGPWCSASAPAAPMTR